ncbi:hypothetical protein HF283_12095, partial [Acidithiobacillus ferrooxidans]|nr:hypothetical protein [Acidithiobacillus ferrooxidans]
MSMSNAEREHLAQHLALSLSSFFSRGGARRAAVAGLTCAGGVISTAAAGLSAAGQSGNPPALWILLCIFCG